MNQSSIRWTKIAELEYPCGLEVQGKEFLHYPQRIVPLFKIVVLRAQSVHYFTERVGYYTEQSPLAEFIRVPG